MRKWVKIAFSKQSILMGWLPAFIIGLVFFLLSRPNLLSSASKIISVIAESLFDIFSLDIPFWILLVLALGGFILFNIKRSKLNRKQEFLLAIMNKGDFRLIDFAFAYKKRWQENSRIKTECFNILKKLERLKLVEVDIHTGGVNSVQEEMFRATDKGKKRIKKIKDEIIEKSKEVYDEAYREAREIEPMDEEIRENLKDIIYILELPASENNKMATKTLLRHNYLGQFRDKNTAHFNYLWSILERKHFVKETGGVTGTGSGYSELPFYITDKGLKFYIENKDVLEV